MNPAFLELKKLDFAGEPSAEEILTIEALLPGSLPGDFVDFLRCVNGAYLPYEIEVDLGTRTETLEFCSIYCTRDLVPGHEDMYFVDRLRAVRRDLGVPDHLVPFAEDGGGSLLFIDVHEDSRGAISAFVYGLPGWTGLAGTTSLVPVAADINDYVARLQLEEDFEE